MYWLVALLHTPNQVPSLQPRPVPDWEPSWHGIPSVLKPALSPLRHTGQGSTFYLYGFDYSKYLIYLFLLN